jgi:hypothetical protein
MNDYTMSGLPSVYSRPVLQFGLVTCLLLISASLAAAQRVDYSRDADVVVASYSLAIGELENPDPGPSVRVYGNGRALVHIPTYMSNGGDYAVQLSAAEMSSLIDTVAADELLQFDPAAVRQAKKDSVQFNRGGGAAGERVLFEVTDPSITTIEVRVRPAAVGGAAGQADEITKAISWSGLETDERQFPEISAIQKLSAAKNRLRAVMERRDLQRLE